LLKSRSQGHWDKLKVSASYNERDASEKIVSAAIDQFGRLDGLVNAAALSDRGSIADAEIALFDHLFAVNTRAPIGSA
jgi:NAD(P)-dependent dehydrogenase (short-subunit alcohol dehydrogenase family)